MVMFAPLHSLLLSTALDIAIGLVSRDALAGGAVPDPNQDDEYPVDGWLYRGQKLISQNGTGHPVVTPLFADIRSQRKIGGGIPALIQNSTTEGGTSFSIHTLGLIRTLVKLP